MKEQENKIDPITAVLTVLGFIAVAAYFAMVIEGAVKLFFGC